MLLRSWFPARPFLLATGWTGGAHISPAPMKRKNSAAVRTALHEMRMMIEIMRANGAIGFLSLSLVTPHVDAIQRAVEDDDLHDPRVVRQNAEGEWEDIPDAP